LRFRRGETAILDPAGANRDISRGSLAPLLRRSTEIVRFLQCNKWPEHAKFADPCALLSK